MFGSQRGWQRSNRNTGSARLPPCLHSVISRISPKREWGERRVPGPETSRYCRHPPFSLLVSVYPIEQIYSRAVNFFARRPRRSEFLQLKLVNVGQICNVWGDQITGIGRW